MQHIHSIAVLKDETLTHIDIQLYDTPLQLAYKYCQEQSIPLSEFRRISRSIVLIIKFHSHSFKYSRSLIRSDSIPQAKRQQLQDSFAKSLLEVEHICPFPLKEVYYFEELLVDPSQSPELTEDPRSTQTDVSSYSFRNDQIQQKLYQMYILSPDAKHEVEEDCSSKRLKQLSILQQLLQEGCGSVQPPLFESDNEQSFQKMRVPSIASTSTIIKPTHIKKPINTTLKRTPKRMNNTPSKTSKSMMATSQSPLGQRATKPSPLRALAKGGKNSYFQSSPDKKVQHLLQRLIYGKKRGGVSPCKQQMDEELENQKSQQLYCIFSSIDSDRDGLISPQKIELSLLSDQILNFMLDLLYEIDHNNLEVNFRQFCKIFEKHYQKLPPKIQQQFLTTPIHQTQI